MNTTMEWLIGGPDDGGSILSNGASDSSYQGFGSFHSENVEDLIMQNDATYRAPDRPSFAVSVVGASGRPGFPMELGDAFFNEHFTMSKDFVFVNHGAFGGSIGGGIAIKRAYEDLMESQILTFVDRKLLPWLVECVRCLASFFKCSPQNLALIQNATFGINSAAQLIQKDDHVCYLDTEYLAVYKIIWTRCDNVGAFLHELPMSHLLHQPDILADDVALTKYIEGTLPAAGCDVFVIDYITSTSAICFPIFTHIVPMLRRRGVRHIIVDGAHTPLQIDLDFSALPPESLPSVMIGNLHKWVCSPKAVGFIWVRDDCKKDVHPAVLSHGAGDGFLSEFIWDGTKDYGSYLAIPALLDFWRMQGPDRIRESCSNLLERAVKHFTEKFGGRPVARRSPFMSLVELPETLQSFTTTGEPILTTSKAVTAKFIQDTLHERYRVEVPVKTVEKRVYIRIAVFAYNKMAHYEYVAAAVLDFAERLRKRGREMVTDAEDEATAEEKTPCTDKVRQQGGCGLAGLQQPTKRKTKAF